MLERRDVEIANQDGALRGFWTQAGMRAHLVEKVEFVLEFRIDLGIRLVQSGPGTLWTDLTSAGLDDVVGRALLPDGSDAPDPPGAAPRVLVPLPHPSGQSRWLNDRARAALLERALTRLRTWSPGPTPADTNARRAIRDV